MPLVIRGNILQSRGRVDWLPDGNATQPSLTFATDPDTGLYRAGVNDLAFTTGGVDRLRVNGAGTTISGNANITGFTTLGNDVTVAGNATITGFTTLSNDVSVSGNANITGFTTLSNDVTVTGNANIAGNTTVSGNLDVTGFITGQGLAADLSISNVQITDNTWTVVDDTALPPEGGKFLLTGGGFAPGSLCQVGGVSAVSTSYVSPTQLRVEAGARATGTYDVTIIRGDTKTAILPYGLTYSNTVTWITSSTLPNVEYGQSFTIQLEATSDSTVTTYANVTPLPAETTLDPVTGNLTGNITSITQSTLFAFDVDAIDQELQDARRSFLLQLLVVLLINGATYTDASWNALTQTALDANSGSVYFTVDGDGMSTVTGVLVGGTPATSFTALNTSTLRVTGPQKPRGTYDVTLQTSSGSKVLQNGVFYSDVPEWLTFANLGVVETGQSFTISLQATSDSAISSYSNVTNIPTEVTFDGISGNLAGNIVSSNTSTVHTFDIAAYDQELQRSLRTFTLQYTYIPGTIAGIKQLYGTTSGVYKIRIGGESKNVFFDLDGTYTGDSTGWMLYQSFGSNSGLTNAYSASNLGHGTMKTIGGWTVYTDQNGYTDTNRIRSWYSDGTVGYSQHNINIGITKAAVKFGLSSGSSGGTARLYLNNSVVNTISTVGGTAIHRGTVNPSGTTPHIRIDETGTSIYEVYWIFVQ